MNKLFASASKNLGQIIDWHLVLSSLIALLAFVIGARALAAPMINGAGATFPEPIYTKWFSEFQKKNPTIAINYQGIGSGGGIRQLIAGTVDFGASDAPMTDAETAKVSKKVLHIPTVMGAVVVSYNLKLSAPLKLSGPVIAEMFNGTITKWNDAKVVALNPGVALPDKQVIVATRSDGSGTTAIFSEYLAQVSPAWAGKAGKTVNWFRGSVGAKGNAGVAGLIQQSEGAVGYIESVYALQNKLPFAHVQNKKGKFVAPDVANISASIPAKAVGDIEKQDFKSSIVNADGDAVYPISALTWLLVNEEMPKEKGEQLVQFLNWTMSDEAQKMATDMNYAPLPKELRTKVLARMKSIKLQLQ
ncbi:MAG: phosphate ABC transporter substrate-binding protein PstS [Bdellovibrionaceae bacterium]|nr:phosphate ABC transporter substrate-binding protein PstS [Pseudobdellovibrionaceae bacterium]